MTIDTMGIGKMLLAFLKEQGRSDAASVLGQ